MGIYTWVLVSWFGIRYTLDYDLRYCEEQLSLVVVVQCVSDTFAFWEQTI